MEKDKKGRGGEEKVEREEEKESRKEKSNVKENKGRKHTEVAPRRRGSAPDFSREEGKRQGSN